MEAGVGKRDPDSHSFFLFVLFLIYFERERESAYKRVGAEREGDRIPSRLHTVRSEPDMGLDPTNCAITT